MTTLAPVRDIAAFLAMRLLVREHDQAEGNSRGEPSRKVFIRRMTRIHVRASSAQEATEKAFADGWWSAP